MLGGGGENHLPAARPTELQPSLFAHRVLWEIQTFCQAWERLDFEKANEVCILDLCRSICVNIRDEWGGEERNYQWTDWSFSEEDTTSLMGRCF